MMIWDKRKAMQTIMASRKHADGSTTMTPMKPESASTEDGRPDGRLTAAQDMLAAMHEGSAQKMMEAMANFHDLHRMESERAQDTTPDVPPQPDSEE